MTRHHCALVDNTVVTAVGSEGTDMSVMTGTMAHRASARIVTNDCAAVAMTFGCALNVYDITGLEQVSFNDIARVQVHHFISSDFSDVLLGSCSSLLGMADGRLVGTVFLYIFITQLNGFIAIGFYCFFLKHNIRLHIDDSHRNQCSIDGEDLSHTQLSS